MHPCSLKYLSACADPFAMHSGVCMPIGEVLDSQKVRCTARGVMSVGVNGLGWIEVGTPFYSGHASINYTTPTYTGFPNSIINYAGSLASGQVQAATIMGPPLAGSTTTGVFAARHVLSALRVRYIGTELNRGGRVIKFVDREDDNVDNMDTASIISRPHCKIEPVDRRWHTVRWTSSDPTVLDFTSEPAYATVLSQKNRNAVYNNARNMFIAVTGTQGNEFEWEFVSYQEYRYNLAQQLWTPSHADTVGGATVTAAVSTPKVDVGDATFEGIVKKVETIS